MGDICAQITGTRVLVILDEDLIAWRMRASAQNVAELIKSLSDPGRARTSCCWPVSPPICKS